jgi:hypothetical protein
MRLSSKTSDIAMKKLIKITNSPRTKTQRVGTTSSEVTDLKENKSGDTNTKVCTNCDRVIKGNLILRCACNKQFCSQECLNDWHRGIGK